MNGLSHNISKEIGRGNVVFIKKSTFEVLKIATRKVEQGCMRKAELCVRLLAGNR